jgi:hypothetical protein
MRILMIAWIASCVMGCMAEDQEATEGPREPSTADYQQAVSVDNPDDDQEAVPGEGPDDTGAGTALARNCVHVQYCDAPSPRSGTICRLHSGCALNQAAINECIRDARRVCKRPVYPWWVLRPGQPIP